MLAPIADGDAVSKAYKAAVAKFEEKWTKGLVKAEEIIIKGADGNDLLDELGRKIGYVEQDGQRIIVLLDESVDNLPGRVLDDASKIGKEAEKTRIVYVDNYKPTSSGKIADIVSPEGTNIGTLYKQTSRSGNITYSFKYRTSSGNVQTISLNAEIYDNFIELNFNIPSELKGKGIGSVAFEDVIKFYDSKGIPYKGIRGRWEGKDFALYKEDGMSDNFKQFRSARQKNMSVDHAAFSTWTGRQAERAGYKTVELITENDELVLIEFFK